MRPTLLSLVATSTLFLAGLAASLSGCSRAGNSGGTKPQPATSGRGGASDSLCKHDVAERFCPPLCHPEVRDDPKVLLCKEHYDIPEDICTACHPELKLKYKTCEHELPPALCLACQNAKDGKGAESEARKSRIRREEGGTP